MKTITLIISVLALLVGGLWLLQGLGLVHMEPILCFADCEPLDGPSTTWALLGLVVFGAGLFGLRRSLRERPRAE